MTDEQLVEQFRGTGDSAALDVLVSRHIGRIRGMIHAIVINSADADDLTQEVFLKAVNHVGRFRRSASFSTWLYRIAMNTAKSFLRKRGRDRLILGETVPDEIDPRPSAPAHAMAREEERALEKALAEGCFLSTIYRRVEAARTALAGALGDAQ